MTDYEFLPFMLNTKHLICGYRSGVIKYNVHKLDTDIPETKLLCLLDVPSYMIPKEIIQFFGGSKDIILSCRVFRHYSDCGKHCAVLRVESAPDAKRLIDDYNGQLMSSLNRCTFCELRFISSISSDDGLPLDPDFIEHNTDVSPLAPDCLHRTGTSPSSSRPLSGTAVVAANVMCSVVDSGQPAEHCPVCLEVFDPIRPMTFTTACGHRFHSACIACLEHPQCPVCRHQHDAAPLGSSECFVCGWTGGGDDDILVAGNLTIADCGEPGSSAGGSPHSPPSSRGLWVCLVCGFTGCGADSRQVPIGVSHIRAHYLETLHTYAMSTDNRRVWDFAGDGFVHRLLLNSSSTAVNGDNTGGLERPTADRQDTTSSSISADCTPKLVEVVDPRAMRAESCADSTTGYTRSATVPLSAEQEEAVVSGKLESAAYHYNQLLAWQLQQNRMMYEMRLQRVRESVVPSRVSVVSGVAVEGGSFGGGDWKRQILSSLRQERARAARQVEAAQERLARAMRDLEMHAALGSSLRQNETEWAQRVQAASDRCTTAEDQLKLQVSPLESQVALLMERLDSLHHSSTGQRK